MPRRLTDRPRSSAHAALGLAVKELRREAGLTQEGLAERIDSDFTYIGYLERGDANPTFSFLLRVVDGLGIELAELVARFEQMQSADPAG